jgi:imidazole glycerol phosphate synthase subunit HisF
MMLKAGADKVAINTALFSNSNLIKQVAEYFGSQCMVAQIDFVKNTSSNQYECLTDNGRETTWFGYTRNRSR